jgi:polyhydroxyalkanoate synthesis regulator phasin
MLTNSLKIATLIAAGALLGAAPALALDGKVVLDKLVKKGVLTPEEADAVIQQDTEKKLKEPKVEKWYDKLKIDGYVQVRYTEQIDRDADRLDVPADKSVKPNQGLMIRRGRVKLTGDITSKVHLYSQFDFQGSVNSADSFALQARDLYADFDLDDDGESRIRAGLSKVPYGWSNLQSSQNRLMMERADALNSGAEGERDYGLYYMWANKESRELFKSLVKDGLKGSGDYGVLTFGAYNGQGLNKPDLNGEPHLVARASYPFKVSDQTFEAGVGGYVGKYVVSNAAVVRTTGGVAAIPLGGTEFRDDRVFATFIMYPQPFGIEAEITCGKGPQLNDARSRIDDAFLWGGYVMANYRIQDDGFEYIPFVRWNYYDGARKFGTNAPQDIVNEFDVGMEFQVGKAWELTLCYTYTKDRTNTAAAPYAVVSDAHRFAAQLQFNF